MPSYCIQLQRNNAIIWNAIVPAIPASGLIGDSRNGQLLTPSDKDILCRLPTRYRKAFTRAQKWWQEQNTWTPLLCNLYSTKGSPMGTLFAIPQF